MLIAPDRLDELLAAARWALEQDVSLPFRESLLEFLAVNGHADVAARV